MDLDRIAGLLRPFDNDAALSPLLLSQVQRYLDLLLRWNARINLTAVRDPEGIVTRHFGESLFAARVLRETQAPGPHLADVGSGAGFPGIPIKLVNPDLALTLIESQSKKAVFLREAVRDLQLDGAGVFCGRAEQWGGTAEVVTLRAVERFAEILPVAAKLVAVEGRLCLLIGSEQFAVARGALGGPWKWEPPAAVPQSARRMVAVARRG